MFRSIDEVQYDCFDYAIMMDSLEYMENDLEYLNWLIQKVRRGGYIFFTLPAFEFMKSEHDEIVGNLRRYDKKSFANLIGEVEGLTIEKMHYFYTTLLFVRIVQKVLRIRIDPGHKVTTGWKYKQSSFQTMLVKQFLNFDYKINCIMSHIGIGMPGLSLMVVCKRD